MSTSVLVVGAAGYIGDGVARAFRRAGYRTYGVVRNEAQKAHLLRHEIIPVLGGLDKPEEYEDVIKRCSVIVDAVYSKGPSPAFFEYVKKVRAHSVQNYKPLYVLTSGIMIYYPGHFDESLIPKTESFEVRPLDEFEMVPKKALEDAVLATTEIRTAVIRPGFVYGGHGGVILPMFFGIDPNEKSLLLTGRPDKRWSWVHVDDLGDAYVKLAQAGSVVNNQIFNVSDQDCPTYEELKITCARAAGWKGEKKDLVYRDVPESEPRMKNWETNVIISPQKANELLGWKPTHSGVLNEADLYFASWKAAKN